MSRFCPDHRLLQRHRPRRRKKARRPRLHRHRLRPQGRDVALLQQQGPLAVQLISADAASIERGRQRRWPSWPGPPLWPVQQRRLRPARRPGGSAHRGAGRAVRDQPVRLAPPFARSCPHADCGRGAHRAEQLRAWPGGHGVSRRLQRQQVRAGRLYRHLRLELTGSGVHVCPIEPGPIDTRFRANARDAFLRHIDPSASRHQAACAPDAGEAGARRGGLGQAPCRARACVPSLLHALRSKRPKHRYPVTFLRPDCLPCCVACRQAAGWTGC